MRRVVYQKFSQNEKLRSLLLSTGDKLIYEHTNRDSYWADGHPRDNPNVHGNGKNMLGIILEEVRYILGGQLSSRFKSMNTFEYSNWIIPGVLLMSGCPREENFIEMKKGGFQYFISLMTSDEESPIGYRGKNFEDPKEDFCVLSDDVILARYEIPDRKITDDEKAISISHVALQGIGRGNPVVLHCFGGKGRTGTIISIIIGLLYGLNGEESMEIAERLFLTHRPNKGKKLAGTKGTPKGPFFVSSRDRAPKTK